MKQRCLNPNCKAYKNYGARGISVCKEWYEFEPFCHWALENGYTIGLDLDRIDNDGGYEPTNCRWVSRKENVNNRRKTTFLTVWNETLCRTEWEERLKLPRGIVKAWCVTHGKEYAEARIEEIIRNGYTEKDYGYSHRKRVMHIESGKIFDSVRIAAKYFNMASCSIVNSIRYNKPTRNGHFSYEVLEEREED